MFLNFFQQKIYNNTLSQWLIALAILVSTLIFARVIYWLVSVCFKQFTKRTESELDDLILKRIDTPVVFGIVLIGFRFAVEQLHFSKPIENYLQRGFVFMSALAITWFLTRVVRAGIEFYFRQMQEGSNGKNEAEMMMLGKRASVIVLWTLGVIVGLNNAGFDVGALIAGLGIGGLALALAAQDTVKNIIGGLVVFIDKPFRIGDAIRIKDIEGTVVYTGIRSTRIRTGAGRIVTIPNAQFTDNAIENISLEPSRRVVQRIMLAANGNDFTKIEKLIDSIKYYLQLSAEIESETHLVFLEKISPAPEIQVIYFVKPNQHIHHTQTTLHLKFLELIQQNGLSLLLPETSSSV